MISVGNLKFDDIIPIVGEDAARRLVDEFPYQEVYIPSIYPEFPNNERNRRIKNLRNNAGWTIKELSNEFNLSESYIYKLINSK